MCGKIKEGGYSCCHKKQILQVLLSFICWTGTSLCQDNLLGLNFTYNRFENRSKIHVTLSCHATGTPTKMTIMKHQDKSTLQEVLRSPGKTYIYWKVLWLDPTCHAAGKYVCEVTGSMNSSQSATLELPFYDLSCNEERPTHHSAWIITLALMFVIGGNGMFLYCGIKNKHPKKQKKRVRWTTNVVISGNRTAFEMPIQNLAASAGDVVLTGQGEGTSSQTTGLLADVDFCDRFYSNTTESNRVKGIAFHNSFYKRISETCRPNAVKFLNTFNKNITEADTIKAGTENPEPIYGTTYDAMGQESRETLNEGEHNPELIYETTSDTKGQESRETLNAGEDNPELIYGTTSDIKELESPKKLEEIVGNPELMCGPSDIMYQQPLTTEDDYENLVLLREEHGVKPVECCYVSDHEDTTYLLKDELPVEESVYSDVIYRPNSHEFNHNCLD